MEESGLEARISRQHPISFCDQGKVQDIPVPLARMYTCGMPTLEVLKEVIRTDPPVGRYEEVSIRSATLSFPCQEEGAT